jgi:hypothetical protein
MPSRKQLIAAMGESDSIWPQHQLMARYVKWQYRNEGKYHETAPIISFNMAAKS